MKTKPRRQQQPPINYGVKRTMVTSMVATVAVLVTLALISIGVWLALRTAAKVTEPIDRTAAPTPSRDPGRTSARLLDESTPAKTDNGRANYQRWYKEQIATTTDIGEIIAARDGRTIRAALVVEPGATWRGWARGRHDRLVGFKALDARMPHLQTALADAYIDTATWHDEQTNTVGAALGDPQKRDRYNIIADVALAATDDEFPNLIIRKIYNPDR